MTPFATLEKHAGVKTDLMLKGIKSMWNGGAWKTLSSAANKGVNQTGMLGRLSRFAKPIANSMAGRVGGALGAYGIIGGVANSALGTNLPGTTLAANIGTPILGAMQTAGNLITGARAGSEKGRAAIKTDLEAGAQRAAQDYISGLHIDPNITNDADSYRNFSEQIGRGMQGADTYTNNGYKPLTGFSKLQSLFGNPNELIQNQVRDQVQQQLPGMMKGAGIGSLAGSAMRHGFTALGIGGAALGLAGSVFGKKTHDTAAIQDEGYAAAQAAIQNRLKGMSRWERMAARWDPSLAGNAIAEKFPNAMKDWESQYGPFQRGALASTVHNFKTGEGSKFYSTDAGGNKNFIN